MSHPASNALSEMAQRDNRRPCERTSWTASTLKIRPELDHPQSSSCTLARRFTPFLLAEVNQGWPSLQAMTSPLLPARRTPPTPSTGNS